MEVGFFFDSYAAIEIVKGNPKYGEYQDMLITITTFNLTEIYWHVLNQLDAKMHSSALENALFSLMTTQLKNP